MTGRFALPWPLFGERACLLLETLDGRLRRLSWDPQGRQSAPLPPGSLAAPFRSYLEGHSEALDAVPLDLDGLPPFRRRVLEALRRLPGSSLTSYGLLARAAGKPGAAQAVGQALRANPLPLVIPCHRVVAADCSLGGYTPGLRWKRILHRHEGFQLDRLPPPATIPSRLRVVTPA